MSRLGFRTEVYNADMRLGELEVVLVPTFPNFRFPNDEIRIRHMSPKSERCPPLSVLQTISAFAVRCKLESSLPSEQPLLTNLHATCFYELMTAVAVVGEEEIHLVAMPSKRKKFPCFWCYAAPKGLYNACLGMLNMRCLAIVFDLDETLIVANTMKSFEDRIEALRGWLSRETDPLRVQGMSSELKRYLEDRLLLKQYAESDSVVDNGRVYKVQMEEVPPLSDSHEKVVRPVVRLQDKNIVLTRINPEIRDTSVLVRLRPAWEDLRCYLTAKGRKRFEVFVCTMAERDYALEMWRLLDPESHLISSKQILDRVICVKSGSRKSLLHVFQDGMCCHPKMAMVIDDRSKVWEDKDQPRVHVVPAFTPYYAPQAETANAVPVLCVARNVACNVRGCFFKEFDENLLQRIAEIFFEDEIVSLPHPPDVSNYLICEDMPNGNANAPTNEGMNGAEVERRLSQPGDKFSVDVVTRPLANNVEVRQETSQPTAGILPNIAGPGSSRTPILSQKPGLLGPPIRHDVNSVDHDYDMKKGLLTMRHGPDIRGQTPVEPPLMPRPPTQASPSLTQSLGGWLVEDDTSSRSHTNNRPFASVKESNAVKSDKHQAQQKSFSHSLPPNALPTQVSQLKIEEATSMCDLQRVNASSKSQQSEDGISPNHASSNGKDIQSEAGKLNNLPSVAIGVLQEIGRRCCSKVEFKSIVSTSKDLQFSVEVLFTGEKIGIGMGRTRKDAQQQAAENALRCLADKYVAQMEPQCRAVDSKFDKLSHGHENGFLWDEVNPESSEQQRKDGLPKESDSAEASDAETRLSTPNAINLPMEKRTSSPRLTQSVPSKRLKE